MRINTVVVDYSNQQQADDLISILEDYAEDPMGGAEPLSSFSRENLIGELKKIPWAFSVITYVNGKPAGFANCFESFSTFKCKPLINIHDFAVRKEFRGQDISQRLLEKIEHIGSERGCCKVTLEVLEGNIPAQKAYLKFGFEPYQLDRRLGNAQFWQKDII